MHGRLYNKEQAPGANTRSYILQIYINLQGQNVKIQSLLLM